MIPPQLQPGYMGPPMVIRGWRGRLAQPGVGTPPPDDSALSTPLVPKSWGKRKQRRGPSALCTRRCTTRRNTGNARQAIEWSVSTGGHVIPAKAGIQSRDLTSTPLDFPVLGGDQFTERAFGPLHAPMHDAQRHRQRQAGRRVVRVYRRTCHSREGGNPENIS